MSQVTPPEGRNQSCCVVCYRLRCEQGRLGILPYHVEAARKAGHLSVGTFDKAMSRIDGGHGL